MEAYTLFMDRKNLTSLKCPYYPKAIYRVNRIPIKIPMAYFTELEQIFQKFMEPRKTWNSYSNFEKEGQSWRNRAT